MKLKISTAIIFILIAITFAFTTKSDSINLPTTQAREVLTAQKLVVIKVIQRKNRDSVDFVSELRDVFTVINYDEKQSSVLLDWTVCPDGKCPEAKMYNPGTREYEQLDSLVIQQLLKGKKK